jgi:hypothetical protein
MQRAASCGVEEEAVIGGVGEAPMVPTARQGVLVLDKTGVPPDVYQTCRREMRVSIIHTAG